MFTRITGDQKRYVEKLRFKILDNCNMGYAKNNPNKYCKVDDALVHLGTFYEEMDTGNPDDTVKQLVKPVKRTCVRIKIEEASLRCLVKKYKRRNPDKNMDDLIEFFKRYYQIDDLTTYMEIIKDAWKVRLRNVPTQ